MQPNTQAQNIAPPQAAAVPPETMAQNQMLQVEVEHNIPIRQPGQPAPAQSVTPLAPAKQFIEEGHKSDKALDGILKDAGKAVKQIDNPEGKGSRFSLKKLFGQKADAPAQGKAAAPQALQPQAGSHMPVLVISAASSVGLVLAVVAVYAFR